MKIGTLCLMLLFALSACNSAMEKEMVELRKENAVLKKQLKSYDNSIVITKENINKYVGALAYGPQKVKTNEPVPVKISLYLHDLPVEVKWKEDQESQAVYKKEKISRTIENTFPGPGKRTFTGVYTVIFPDGEEWQIPWMKEVEVTAN